MTKLKISVTKEILIASAKCTGHKGDLLGTNCAIAVAVRDIFPAAHVSRDCIDVDYWDRPGAGNNMHIAHISLPRQATAFIDTFDSFGKEHRIQMQPISFDVEIPDEVLEKINIEEIKPLLENHPSLQIVE